MNTLYSCIGEERKSVRYLRTGSSRSFLSEFSKNKIALAVFSIIVDMYYKI